MKQPACKNSTQLKLFALDLKLEHPVQCAFNAISYVQGRSLMYMEDLLYREDYVHNDKGDRLCTGRSLLMYTRKFNVHKGDLLRT